MSPSSDTKPRLITFGISHYCEKARWALDWHAIEYEEVCWPPGIHLMLARRLGTQRSTLPILLSAGGLIQDSSRIVDWADQHGNERERRLAIDGESAEADEIERRLNEHTAVQVRRYVYAETLAEHPEAVKPALFMNTARRHRLLAQLMWPITRKRIMAGYDATPATVADARAALERDLDWLDQKLSDGRRHLIGDRFTRVDLTVASLLAALSRPPELPRYSAMDLPTPLTDTLERWATRPILCWVNSVYANYRFPQRRTGTAG